MHGGAGEFEFDFGNRFAPPVGDDPTTIQCQQHCTGRGSELPGDATKARFADGNDARQQFGSLQPSTHGGLVNGRKIEMPGVGNFPLGPAAETGRRGTGQLDGLQPAARVAAQPQRDAATTQGKVGRVVVNIVQDVDMTFRAPASAAGGATEARLMGVLPGPA